jgi:hypothetical protein
MMMNDNYKSTCKPKALKTFLLVACIFLVGFLQNASMMVQDYQSKRYLEQVNKKDSPLRRSIYHFTNEVEKEKEPPRRRQLNILTLGGSVTWGAEIDNREDAYPFRLQNDHGHNVLNLAIRATGPDYPAQCITSMMLRESKNDDPDEDVPFDVIIFEFSINGLNGFPLLVERLQVRYPEALFVYVDFFSLTKGNFAEQSTDARKLIKGSGGSVYFFGNTGHATAEFNFREEIDLENPTDDVRQLFADDGHHASSLGHNLMATKLVDIIDQQDFPTNPILGSWLGGDKCTSWYDNGKSSLRIISGGEMKEWDETKHKWAIEIQGEEGVMLQIDHDDKNAAPVNLQYMTKAEDKYDNTSSKYPPVIVNISQDWLLGASKAKERAIKSEVELVRNDVEKVEKIEEGWRYLSGLHKRTGMKQNHVTEISNVGILKPGINFIYVYPLETKDYPFRLTATIMCEACGRLGWNDWLSKIL